MTIFTRSRHFGHCEAVKSNPHARTASGCSPVQRWRMTVGPYDGVSGYGSVRALSWPAEEVSASQDGLCRIAVVRSEALSTAPLEKLIVSQLAKQFPSRCGIQSFIACSQEPAK